MSKPKPVELLADLETLLAHATYLHAVAQQTNRGWTAFMANVVEYARTSLEAERATTQTKSGQNDESKGKRFFQTEEEYQEFRRTFFENVKEDLERFQEARQQSEEEAKQHWIE